MSFLYSFVVRYGQFAHRFKFVHTLVWTTLIACFCSVVGYTISFDDFSYIWMVVPLALVFWVLSLVSKYKIEL
jgi:hypothetical protein